MNRATMQGLKVAKDEENRKALIQSIVEKIYNAALNSAKTKTDTSYQFRVPPPPSPPTSGAQQCVIRKHSIWNNDHNMPQTFDMAHMTDVLAGLQALFPDCSVSEKTLVQAQDGKFYDVSTMDPQFLPLINNRLNQDFIIIDWS